MTDICPGCSEEIDHHNLQVLDYRNAGTTIWSHKTFYFHDDHCLGIWTKKRVDKEDLGSLVKERKQ